MIFKSFHTRTHLLFLMLLMMILSAAAQPGKNPKRERIEALRVSFLTNRLELTPREAQSFWPLYNEYQDKLDLERKSRRLELKELKQKDGTTITEADANKLIDSELAFHAKEAVLMKQYYEQFRKVLPATKVVMLLRAEEEFKRELLKQLKDRN